MTRQEKQIHAYLYVITQHAVYEVLRKKDIPQDAITLPCSEKPIPETENNIADLLSSIPERYRHAHHIHTVPPDRRELDCVLENAAIF